MARNAHQQQHRHKVCHHLFADDMQGHGSGPFDDFPVIVSRLEGCIADIYAWCGAKRLQLNADKTELLCSVLHCSCTSCHHRRLPSTSTGALLTVGRDLGMWFDAKLSMRSHITRVMQTCFYQQRQIRAVRKQLGCDVTVSLVTELDCCNTVLAGLPASTVSPFQRVVMHAVARILNQVTV